MSCGVGEATEWFGNEVTQVKRRKGWRMSRAVDYVSAYERGIVMIFTQIRLCYEHNGSFQIMGGSPGDVSEEPVTQEKRKKCLIMSYDVGEATERLENEL